MINAKLDGLARTLLLTVRARADEQLQDTPLLVDSWSAEWNKFLPKYEDLESWYNPAFQLATIIRSRIIDDMAREFIETHDKPLVVELGAGLSTRYFRIGQGTTRWIELDVDDAIALRHKLDIAIADHWFIKADFTENNDWLAELPEAKNVLFIAEGVLMFAEEDKVKDLFETLKRQFKNPTIIFDVVNPGYIERAADEFAKLRAPMKWGIEAKKVKSLGVKVEDTAYLLTQYPERWDAIGMDKQHLTEDRSGYVVKGILK